MLECCRSGCVCLGGNCALFLQRGNQRNPFEKNTAPFFHSGDHQYSMARYVRIGYDCLFLRNHSFFMELQLPEKFFKMVLGVIVDLGYCFPHRAFAFSAPILRDRRICKLFYNCKSGCVQSRCIDAANGICHAVCKLDRGIVVVMAYSQNCKKDMEKYSCFRRKFYRISVLPLAFSVPL